MIILWLKALHLFFLIAWMAGLFYLPRLFVYHSQTENRETSATFKLMEKRLWWFVTPFAALTLAFGLALIHQYGYEWFAQSRWLHIKLALLIPMYGYHFYLFHLVKVFASDHNRHSTRFYRFLNEIPVLVFLAIILLAVIKPA
jgi:putative membrane protein